MTNIELSPLGELILRLHKRGTVKNMQDKLNIFLLADQLNIEEYEYLTKVISNEENQ